MSTAEEFDIGEGAKAPDALAELKALLGEAIVLEQFVEQAENELKAAKATLQALKTGRIPDVMTSIQSDHFRFAGWDVSVGDFVSGSLPKEPEARAKAIKLLESYGAEALITTDISLTFAKSEHNIAIDVAETLRSAGHAVSVASGVHTQTLCKFVRDRLESGEPVDTEALGLYTGKVAKFKPVKQKGARR